MTTTSLTCALLETFVPRWRAPSRIGTSHSSGAHEVRSWQVPLAHGQLRRFEPAALRGLRCISGALWITFDGDPADHVLQPGEAMQTKARHAVIVYALEPSVLRIQGDT